MKNDFYNKLVDIYAGRDLPEELELEMEWAAFRDSELSHDMTTLRQTVDALKSLPQPDFTEESYQRILMKLYAKGACVEPKAPTPVHLQYQLPIQT